MFFVVVVFKQELKQESPTECKIKFLLSVLYLYSSLSKLVCVIFSKVQLFVFSSLCTESDCSLFAFEVHDTHSAL